MSTGLVNYLIVAGGSGVSLPTGVRVSTPVDDLTSPLTRPAPRSKQRGDVRMVKSVRVEEFISMVLC